MKNNTTLTGGFNRLEHKIMVLKYKIESLWNERRLKPKFTRPNFTPNNYCLKLNSVRIRELIKEIRGMQ